MAEPDPKSPFDFLHEADGPTPGETGSGRESKGDDLTFFDDLAAEVPLNGASEPTFNLEGPSAAAESAIEAELGMFNFEDESKAEPPLPPTPPEASLPDDPQPGDEPEDLFNFTQDDASAAPAPLDVTQVDDYEIASTDPASGDAVTQAHAFNFGDDDAAAAPAAPPVAEFDQDFPTFLADPPTADGGPRFEEDSAGLDPSLVDEATAAAGLAAFAAGAVADVTAAEEPPLPDPEIEETTATPAPLAEDHPHMQTYAKLCGHVREASQLGAIEALLGWDERCMMPAAGAEQRADQITLLSGIIHDRLTDPRIGEWLNQLSDGELARDKHDDFGATLHHLRRQYHKRTKLPKELVEELAHTAVMGQHVWQEAREQNDFAKFAPLLTKMVDLKRQQADAQGFTETRYDALLDEFEPGELTSRVTQVLGALRDELVPLVAQVRDGGRAPDLGILQRQFPIETQRTFGRGAAAKIGFNFERGRLDVTAHPFCTGLGSNDCRITTRYDEHYFNSGFFGILHEAGHGIYDQGLRAEQYGLPMGEAVSMGIHESQSRMWEILVGRSLPFWKHFYPQARSAFPAALGDVTLGRFFFAVNDVRPSLIRVEADEFTYNLHILIRFELEQALISGDLSVADLPDAWREKYRSYLGIECPNDADGVLQDIHWSAGLFGYFPTYSLGNLYASQFYEQADQELGGLSRRFERGEFGLLKRWLQQKIHRQGQRYSAGELCERITGRTLSHEPLMRHLRAKYDLLYSPSAEPLDDYDVGVAPTQTSVGGFGLATETEAVGGYGLASNDAFGGTAADDFGSKSFGGAAKSATATYKAKKSGGGLVTALIMLFGIVGGGVIGISLGLWILLWLKGPAGDLFKIRDKLPSWIVPTYVDPNAEPVAPEPTPQPTPPPPDEPQPIESPPTGFRQSSSSLAAAAYSGPVGRMLTERVLAAARLFG